MHLPNPVAAYRRWELQRRLRLAGFDPELAAEILSVLDRCGMDEAEMYAFQRLAAQCYYDLQMLDSKLN